MPLTGKQRRLLRARGHHLHAVVQVGASGVTPGVLAAVEQALADHELVKVRIADEREGRSAAVDELVQGTGAELAQVLGKTVLLFKKRKKKSKFDDLDAEGGDRASGSPEVEPTDGDAPAPTPRRKPRSPR